MNGIQWAAVSAAALAFLWAFNTLSDAAVCDNCWCIEGERLPDRCGNIRADGPDGACAWLAQHPEKEHIMYAQDHTYHCQALGGRLIGGLEDQFCRQVGGTLSAALRNELGKEALDGHARACSKASGIPPAVLLTNLQPDQSEWIPANCPNYRQWTRYADQDANALRGLKGWDDVPAECVNWGL